MTIHELRREINERRPGWVGRTSRRIDKMLGGPSSPVPLALWIGGLILLFCVAGWLDG